MTATVTLHVIKTNGFDTRLQFPGLLPVTPEGMGGFNNLGTCYFARGNRHFEMAAVGTFYSGRPYAEDLAGTVISMGLNAVSGDEGEIKTPLARISFSLDDASDGYGGAPINSFLQLTPDGLLNPLAALTDVEFRVIGNKGDDKIFGSDYHDRLDGRRGSDLLTGYAGSDTFIFGKGYGKDTIADFQAKGAGHDRIDLSHLVGVDDFKDLKAHHLEDHGSDVWVDAGKDMLIIKHQDIHDLAKADFIF